ncbi:MAG TPA: antibiotic biosynthesis monooxygenase [Acidimicrobiales bacterium]|nr:antibiotic biosynthesis monooxygenase [Acidimicrobiales bacterium]
MAQIAMVVKLPAAEGRRDELLAAAGKLVAAAEGEPGTVQYVAHTEQADPSAVWFYELYADQAAFDAHSGSAAMAEAMATFGDLLAGDMEMHVLEIAHRKGG